jgi:DNA invertase Pin-like site-specific DNA recombinase
MPDEWLTNVDHGLTGTNRQRPGAVHIIERELVKERTTAGLAAARARGRTGGRPTVMTTAKVRAAQRMISAGTPLTEVASVLGVGRATLYRHLQATSPTA